MSKPALPRARALSRAARALASIVVPVLALLIGFALRGWIAPQAPAAPEAAPAAGAPAQEYTCSMHPQIRQPTPGLCPICAMDLIPVTAGGGGEAHPRRLSVSPASRDLMRVETAPVERRFAEAEVRLVGKAAYDETKLAYITAWVPGRIDRLYADYTGVNVKKGDHLVDLYSPELIGAKQELERATRALATLPANAPAILRDTAQTTVEAVRAKLRRWGMTDAQIAAAQQNGGSDRITIHAPIGGTVIERMGAEGMYVMMGERILSIADLSTVWVMLDAYESDLAWLHFGQPVEFESESWPGERFEGKIAFIDPALDAMTRTVRVRVNVPNPGGRLKPGMFVRATVRAQVATGGRVMNPALAGKWISPMHPEIVKDKPGACDVCGMALVRAEELGYVAAEAKPEDMPLVVPASAVLRTGRRAVVYVEAPDAAEPTFEGRVVELGPRAGDFYIVRSGVAEGERVVINGNFKIDAELQIQAKESMMSLPSESAEPDAFAAAPAAFKQGIAHIVHAYLELSAALAGDDAAKAKTAAAGVQKALGAAGAAALHGQAAEAWRARLEPALKGASARAAGAADVAALRAEFWPLTQAVQAMAEAFGGPEGSTLFVVHCPMARGNQGADWLQTDREVRNPYFGAEMLACGAVKGPLGAGGHAHE